MCGLGVEWAEQTACGRSLQTADPILILVNARGAIRVVIFRLS